MGAPLPNGGRVQHVNGTVGTTAVKVQPADKQESAFLDVHNPDGTRTLSISFDGGKNFFSVFKGEHLVGPYATKELWLKGDAASTPYAILWTSVV